MYDKNWYKSKTVLGFALAGLIAIGQIYGVQVSESTIAEILKVLSMFLGAYGMRDAVANQ